MTFVTHGNKSLLVNTLMVLSRRIKNYLIVKQSENFVLCKMEIAKKVSELRKVKATFILVFNGHASFSNVWNDFFNEIHFYEEILINGFHWRGTLEGETTLSLQVFSFFFFFFFFYYSFFLSSKMFMGYGRVGNKISE